MIANLLFPLFLLLLYQCLLLGRHRLATDRFHLYEVSQFLCLIHLLHVLKFSKFVFIFIDKHTYFHLIHFCLYFVLRFLLIVLIQHFQFVVELLCALGLRRFSDEAVNW